MQKISPFLWFDTRAEEAANYYVEVFSKFFPDSKITEVVPYPKAAEEVSGKKAGSVMTISFRAGGEDFTAINGGPNMKFSGAVSFVIDCQNQEEVDYFWDKLSDGGEAGQCGWINQDKFGMTWQIVPNILPKLLSDPDAAKSERVMQAMLGMTKIVIADLEKAAEGK